MSRHKALVIHALRPTSRQTTVNRLLAFREHLPNADVQYVHFAQPLPREIENHLVPEFTIVNYDFFTIVFASLVIRKKLISWRCAPRWKDCCDSPG